MLYFIEMNKILPLFFACCLLLVGCDRVLVNGTVTYQPNEYAQPKIDRYAQVYLTQSDVGDLTDYLTIRQLESSIASTEKRMGYSKDSVYVDSLRRVCREDKVFLEKIRLDSLDLLSLEMRAFEQLHALREGGRTYRSMTDERGTYSRKVRVGEYVLLVISEGAKGSNPLERSGQIFFTPLRVEKDSFRRLDVNFVVEK